jgi:hypothetical protein
MSLLSHRLLICLIVFGRLYFLYIISRHHAQERPIPGYLDSILPAFIFRLSILPAVAVPLLWGNCTAYNSEGGVLSANISTTLQRLALVQAYSALKRGSTFKGYAVELARGGVVIYSCPSGPGEILPPAGGSSYLSTFIIRHLRRRRYL